MSEMTLAAFLETLASSAPTPGGGSVAALSAANGAAMIAMVGRLTVGKPGFEDVEDRMNGLILAADAARKEFLELADTDAHAFDGVMVAFKMPKETAEETAARSAAIQSGYAEAAAVPQSVARKAIHLMELAEDATAMGNAQAASDGLSAAASLYCAALCAIANVEINASAFKDEAKRVGMLDELAGLKGRADELLRETQTAFQLRLPH
ncbi:MAG: cyclodeaminase/cyclohydrolase family protein [Actinomycetota bacterium]